MSKLLEELDEVIQSLESSSNVINEKLSDNQKNKLMELAHLIDPKVNVQGNDVEWDRFDSKWDKLVLQAANAGALTRNRKTTYLKATNVKDGDGNPVTGDVYVSWTESSNKILPVENATLVSKDNASKIIDDNRINGITLGVKKALAKDSKTANYSYEDIVPETTTEKPLNSKGELKKGTGVTLNEAIQFYFNCIVSNATAYAIDFNNLKAWKKFITDDVTKKSSVTTSPSAQFILELLIKQVSFNSKRVIDILTSDLTDDNNFVINLMLTGEVRSLQKYTYTQLVSAIETNSNFLLNALLLGCYTEMNYKGTLASFADFNNFNDAIGQNIETKISAEILNRVKASNPKLKTTEDLAKVVSRNLILLPDGQLQKSPLIYPEQNPEINALTNPADIATYKAADRNERVTIFERVYVGEDTGSYFLVVGSKKYALIENGAKTLTCKASKISFEPKEIVKVIFGVKDAVSTGVNLFDKLTDLSKCVYLEDYDQPAKALFSIDADTKQLRVSDEGFTVNGKNAVSFTLGEGSKVTRINIDGRISAYNKEEVDSSSDEDSENKSSDKPKDKMLVSEQDAVKAIKQYLIKNKTKALKTELAVNDFMDKVQVANLERMKKAVIEELRKNPTAYGYNEQNNQIYGVNGKVDGTLLDILVSLLNGDTKTANDKAVARKTGNHNISNAIVIDTEKLKPSNLSPKTVAQRLKAMAAILDSDPANNTDKVDKATIKQIPKSDLAELISWFNSRYNPKYQTIHDNTKPEETTGSSK